VRLVAIEGQIADRNTHRHIGTVFQGEHGEIGTIGQFDNARSRQVIATRPTFANESHAFLVEHEQRIGDQVHPRGEIDCSTTRSIYGVNGILNGGCIIRCAVASSAVVLNAYPLETRNDLVKPITILGTLAR